MNWMKNALMVFGVLAVVAGILSPNTAHSGDELKQVLSLLAEERYPEARELLDSMLKSDSTRPLPLLAHGILSVREGDVREAIDTFKRLQRNHPDMFEPYNNLAVLYAKHGRLEDAHDTLLAALEHNQEAILYANLGDVYMNLAHRAYICARELNTSAHTETHPKRDETMDPISNPLGTLSDFSDGLGMGVEPRRPVSDLQRPRCTSFVDAQGGVQHHSERTCLYTRRGV